jgi:hypothetical protein
MTAPETLDRSLALSASEEPRFWWHRLPRSNYVPPIYANLTDQEWQLLQDWFEETTRQNLIGECVVPIMSVLHGLIMGSEIQRIVQLGTHAGYSALLLGFSLRQMHAQNGLSALKSTSSFTILPAHGSSEPGSTPSSKWSCGVGLIPLHRNLPGTIWAVRRS